MVWMFCQKGEEIKLFGGKCFLFTGKNDAAGCFINNQIADLNDFICLLPGRGEPFVAGQVRFDASYQLAWTERFGHVIISPQT